MLTYCQVMFLNLKQGTIYSLDVEYSVPSSCSFPNTYFHLNLGNGAYITTLMVPHLRRGRSNPTATGFEKLVKTPTGTGTIYGYPTAGSAQAKW